MELCNSLGRQYHLEIAGDDYYLDMLFYHIKLRCYSLERSIMPMGISEYKVNIMDALPKELRGTLPTAAEIEAKLIEHSSEDVLDRNEL